MKLNEDIVRFFKKEGFVIVSSLDEHGGIHCAAKGIVEIDIEGKVFIIDLYLNRTFRNLKTNHTISITAVNEKKFQGYTLQGRAKLVYHKDITDYIRVEWEKKIIQRISKRVISGVQAGTKSSEHFEAGMPSQPKYLIEMDVDKVIDLAHPVIE
ncbi:MAG: pyridoxamine 5'-phosphate oxidase family protein [Candidatus Omnitrophica bacterium]|nr:pyridoxamine 5'-phosphate oxidase family protein [Candidatus Omnitrophota bacterium]